MPLTLGFLVAAPFFGRLSDKYGARPFTTTGMLLAALLFSSIMCALAALASWLRGGKFVHEEAAHAHIEVVPEPVEAEV